MKSNNAISQASSLINKLMNEETSSEILGKLHTVARRLHKIREDILELVIILLQRKNWAFLMNIIHNPPARRFNDDKPLADNRTQIEVTKRDEFQGGLGLAA